MDKLIGAGALVLFACVGDVDRGAPQNADRDAAVSEDGGARGEDAAQPPPRPTDWECRCWQGAEDEREEDRFYNTVHVCAVDEPEPVPPRGYNGCDPGCGDTGRECDPDALTRSDQRWTCGCTVYTSEAIAPWDGYQYPIPDYVNPALNYDDVLCGAHDPAEEVQRLCYSRWAAECDCLCREVQGVLCDSDAGTTPR